MSRNLCIKLNSEENKLITFVATEFLKQPSLDRAIAFKYLALRKASELYDEFVKQIKKQANKEEKDK